MPSKPLLVFPAPTRTDRYKKRNRIRPTPFTKPRWSTQVERIQPVFSALEQTFESQRAQLQTTASGIDPEMVLVFETRGPITDFLQAVKKFPELEWMGELDQEFEADELFHYQDENKNIIGKLFLVMTNQQALLQLKSLWDNYYTRNIGFQHGFSKWKALFDLLYTIRPWDVKDRISETGLLENVQFRIQHEQNVVPFEIELWYRESETKRAQAKENLQILINEVGGEIVSESLIPEIAYHAFLVKAPISAFDDLTINTDVKLFTSQDIMYLRPVGQCSVILAEEVEDVSFDNLDSSQTTSEPLVLGLPVVGLFDGLPLQNHTLLADRLVIDDPDNFEEGYSASFRRHGTAMASLLLHGDLNANEQPIKSKVYVRPIMKPDGHTGAEVIPEDTLVLDLIHRAVRRLFEDNDIRTTHNIKVINLSIGDPARVYDNSISSWAKLLDWLSFKYKVLFVVSAGNCADDFELNLTTTESDALVINHNERSKVITKHLYDNVRHRKIISPAESINALTVGATHEDACTNIPNLRRVDPFVESTYCSPISRLGYGHRKSIKPEVVLPGGRIFITEPLPRQRWRLSHTIHGPGQLTAAPSHNGFSGNTYTRGTSNAAALMSRTAAKLYEELIASDGIPDSLVSSNFGVLAKTLLVHGAAWDETHKAFIADALQVTNGDAKHYVKRFVGYGKLNKERILSCDKQRVTLVGCSSLGAEDAHLYSFPLPLSITGNALWKQLTVSLGWFSPVSPLSQVYRKAKLWFDFPDNSNQDVLNLSRKFYDHNTVQRGTIQHEVYDGSGASAFVEGTTLKIRVSCKSDSSRLRESVPYAIAVTLEVDSSIDLPIYNEVKTKVQQSIRVQA